MCNREAICSLITSLIIFAFALVSEVLVSEDDK